MKLIYPQAKCLYCDGSLYRSHRRGLVERFVFRLLLIHAYRCERCGRRYYAPPSVMFESGRSPEPGRHTSDGSA